MCVNVHERACTCMGTWAREHMLMGCALTHRMHIHSTYVCYGSPAPHAGPLASFEALAACASGSVSNMLQHCGCVLLQHGEGRWLRHPPAGDLKVGAPGAGGVSNMLNVNNCCLQHREGC